MLGLRERERERLYAKYNYKVKKQIRVLKYEIEHSNL